MGRPVSAGAYADSGADSACHRLWPVGKSAVPHINNLRDINSDRENGKNTLVVRLGAVNARRYHACLLMGTLVCLALFNLFSLCLGMAVYPCRSAAFQTGALRDARNGSCGNASDAGTHRKSGAIN